MNINKLIDDFIKLVKNEEIELYNEFSMQHELGIYLREKLEKKYKVQFERNVSYFIIEGTYKKEIDITIFEHKDEPEIAIELKYLINGRVPESIYDCCKDIAFLEQLKDSGFKQCYSIIIADPNFHTNGSRKKNSGIYSYFRDKDNETKENINGIIKKPTGDKNHSIKLTGSYQIEWKDLIDNLKYAIIKI